MATLVILCLNGRRQQVKASPNKILLEVLEEVCKKQGLDPSQYGLKHGRQTLDLTVPVRYANLANNAKLELIKVSVSRGEAATKIALQLESGERLEKDFLPTTSLWDVLQHWNTDKESPVQGQLLGRDGFDPVCVYLSQEFFKKSMLQQATLRSLGLRGGRAAVRLSYRVTHKTATETESGLSSGHVVKEDMQGATRQEEVIPEVIDDEVVEMETKETQAMIAAGALVARLSSVEAICWSSVHI
jgi:tether containing UBX domain for GLUT4